MGFLRRLRMFMVGIVLGLVLVVFLFNDRMDSLTGWLPNSRVLLRLQLTEAAFTPEALCLLTCHGLDTSHVRTVKYQGDVRFKYSDTHSEPKRYRVDHRFGEHLVRMTFDADSVASTLTQVERPNAPIDCACPNSKSQ